MTLAKYREALDDLPDDASEDDARAALEAAGLSLASPESTPVTAAAVPAGMIVLAASKWDETQKTIKTLTDFVEQTKRGERDQFIVQAIKDGKLAPADRQQMSEQWDLNPDFTRAWIERLPRDSRLAVTASGYAGEGVEADAEYAALYGAPDARKAG